MTDIHKHCPVCNTPIPLEETTCSPKCQSALSNKQAQAKRGKIVMNIVMVILLVIVAYVFIISKFL